MTEIESSSPLFCGIQAYSAIGGIQRFDRHVVKALSEIQSDRGRQPPVVSFLRDASVPEPPRPDAEFLFFAGDLRRDKGVPTLLEAYAGLSPDRPPLIMVGRRSPDVPAELPGGVRISEQWAHPKVIVRMTNYPYWRAGANAITTCLS